MRHSFDRVGTADPFDFRVAANGREGRRGGAGITWVVGNIPSRKGYGERGA